MTYRINRDLIIYFICGIALFFAQISEKIDNVLLLVFSYIVIVTVSLVVNKNDIWGIILFLLSDNKIFNLGGISVQLILMSVYLVRYLYNRGTIKVRLKKYTFIIAVIFAAYSLIYTKYGISIGLQGAKLSLMIIFYTEFFSDNVIDSDFYEKNIGYAVWGLFVSLLIAIIINPSMLSLSRVRLSENSNHNLLGILGAILFSHSLLNYFHYQKKKYLIYSIMTLFGAIISTSRTALIALIFSVVWCVFADYKRKSSINKKLIIIVMMSVIGICLLTGLVEITYVNQLVERIIHPRRGDISNGRFTLWAKYIKILANDTKILLFGYGQSLIEGVTTNTDITKSLAAHNLFIEQLIMYGVVGNSIITALYITSYKYINSKSHIRKNSYLLNIIIVFIVGCFSHLLTSVLVTTELYLGIVQYMAYKSEYKDS